MRHLGINVLVCLSIGALFVEAAVETLTDKTRTKAQETTQPMKIAEIQQDQISEDIIINSLEEGSQNSGDGAKGSDRHHYEQQASEQVVDAQLVQSGEQTKTSSKPEPRAQQQDQDQQTDPVIIDHRPLMDQQTPNVIEAFTSSTPTTQPPTQQSTASTLPTPHSAPTTAPTSQAQTQQQATPPTTNGWYSQVPPPSNAHQSAAISYTHMPTHAQSVSTYVPVGSSSNQVHTIQYPNSINAIINEQQQQSQASNSMVNPTTQQSQLVSVNGQPANLILVNPNTMTTTGGRRISIPNWLRGISSMLANIFNRRDHGAQTLMGQSSNNAGHWIQLGPNAPHWLSQAQSVIQQQQQQFQQQFNNNPQQLLGSASTNRYATFIATPQNIGQQPTTMTIAMIGGQSQVQPSTNSNQANLNQATADLQSSASSTSYQTIQNPGPQTQSQQQPQQVSNANQYQSSAQANSGQLIVGNLQSGSQVSQTNNQPTVSPIKQSHVDQQQLQRPASAIGQQQSSSPQTRPRFSRSSTLASNQNLPLAHYSRYALLTDR